MTQLTELIQNIDDLEIFGSNQIAVNNVSNNSKKIKSGDIIEKRIVYPAEAATFITDAAQQALRYGEVVGIFIFSPRSAMILNELIRKFNLQDSLKPVTAFCLSETVAKEASYTVWKKILVSEKPTQKSILALARDSSKSLLN